MRRKITLVLSILFLLIAAVFLLTKRNREKTLAQQADPLPALILNDSANLLGNINQEFSRNLTGGEEFDLFVYLYPQNQSLVAADVEMSFDPQVVEVLGKTDGDLFPTFVEPVDGGYLDQVNGRISLSGVAFDLGTGQPTASISASGKYASFRLKIKDGLTSQVSQISFNPQTADLNQNLTTDTNLVSFSGSDNEPTDVLGQVNVFKVVIDQPGDINGDSQVNISDFFYIARYYGQSDFELRADINRDGKVDLADFFQIARNYGINY